MILIDRREKPGKREKDTLQGMIKRIGVPCDTVELAYGDFAFEGNGPKGPILVGVERKRIHDMLMCIDDSRYSAHQLVGMKRMYAASFLVIEGAFKPRDPQGTLMEGTDKGFWDCRPGGRPVLYAKLRRYLFSVSLSGVVVLYTRDMWHTAYDVCELYHYFQKKWKDHRSLTEKQKLNVASLSGRPSLTRRWAEELDGVGQTFGEQAERLFKTPIALADSVPEQWQSIPRIGEELAKDIVDQIQGVRRKPFDPTKGARK